VVVGGGEGVEVLLEFGDGAGCGVGVEEAFEGLMEAFDLAAGGRVVGS